MAFITLAFKRTSGKHINLLAITKAVNKIDALNKETAAAMKKDFQQTVSTWVDKPDFDEESFSRQDESGVSVGTDDQTYRYISGGTRVRYAIMTPDFSPKTQPRRLRSRRGRGGLAFVSKRHPLPGIKAREFEIVIRKRHESKYKKRVTRIWKEAIS